MLDAKDSNSTRPYLIRALYEWCTDSGFTPFIAVLVDDSVRVPNEYVKDGEIVLNISFDATSALQLGNECIEFKGRFGGVARDIRVPVNRVLAIYARENGQGMAFPLVGNRMEDTTDGTELEGIAPDVLADLIDPPRPVVWGSKPEEGPQPPRPTGGRPQLKRVK